MIAYHREAVSHQLKPMKTKFIDIVLLEMNVDSIQLRSTLYTGVTSYICRAKLWHSLLS